MITEIAKLCHEANRAYCLFQGDTSQKEWAASPDWQKESAINGVKMYIEFAHASPEDSHEAWCREKIETGWKYGATKDPEKKEHPCLVTYQELPYEQQMKDSIFGGIAKSMIAKAIASGRLIVGRPLTLGEEAIDVSFNVGGNPAVHRIKQGFADLHDLLVRESEKHHIAVLNREARKRREQLAKDHPDWNVDDVQKASIGPVPTAIGRMGRLISMALTDIENGAMHAVKAITR